jgi:hypothetical protein
MVKCQDCKWYSEFHITGPFAGMRCNNPKRKNHVLTYGQVTRKVYCVKIEYS